MIEVFADIAALNTATAERIVAAAGRAVAERGAILNPSKGTINKGGYGRPVSFTLHPQWAESFALHSSDSLLASHQGSRSRLSHAW